MNRTQVERIQEGFNRAASLMQGGLHKVWSEYEALERFLQTGGFSKGKCEIDKYPLVKFTAEIPDDTIEYVSLLRVGFEIALREIVVSGHISNWESRDRQNRLQIEEIRKAGLFGNFDMWLRFLAAFKLVRLDDKQFQRVNLYFDAVSSELVRLWGDKHFAPGATIRAGAQNVWYFSGSKTNWKQKIEKGISRCLLDIVKDSEMNLEDVEECLRKYIESRSVL